MNTLAAQISWDLSLSINMKRTQKKICNKPQFMQIHKTIGISLLILFFLILSTTYSEATIVVLNGLTHEKQIHPGETYRGTIQIQNTAKKEKSVRVYQKDYWFSHTGESKHDPTGTLPRSNGSWISFSPELLTLGPNQITTVNFEVKVPENDTLRGTYWSVLMVEGITPPDTSNFNSGVTINTAIRYAVQVITNIGNSGKNDIQFLGLNLDKQQEQNVLDVIIKNTGERILKPEMSIELFDSSGETVAVIKAEKRKTFPGTSIRVQLILEGVKPGNYTGVLIADCGEDNIFGTNLSLEIG